jgi:hypothetical protein
VRQRSRANSWLVRVLAVGALTSAIGVLAASGTAAAAPPPQLSISLSDGVETVHSDMSVSYSAAVENSGAKAVAGTLALDVPTYGHYTKTAGGKTAKQHVSWKVRVPAGKTVRKTATVRLATIAQGQSRVTTLASFYVGRTTGPPIVRTADADRIQGVADPAPVTSAAPSTAAGPTKAAPSKAATSSSDSGLGAVGWILIGVGVLLVLAIAFWLWRRGNRDARGQAVEPRVDDRETVDVPTDS